jgi:uncharacterized membrane protein
MYQDGGRHHLWLRLNSMGVLIALLEITAAVVWMADPSCLSDACTFPAVGWFVHATYLVSGLLLIGGYWSRSVTAEVFGLTGLLVANLTSVVRDVVFSDASPFDVTVAVAVAVAVGLRMSALMQGGTVTFPAWRRWRRGG